MLYLKFFPAKIPKNKNEKLRLLLAHLSISGFKESWNEKQQIKKQARIEDINKEIES